MKKEIADKWIEALESGKYKQAAGVLFDGEGHCCLGVLCEVLGEKPEREHEDYSYQYDGDAGVLSEALMEKAGMSSDNGMLSDGITLTHENDTGKTFPEIAQIIRENWEKL